MLTGKRNQYCLKFIIVMLLTLAGLSWKFSGTEYSLRRWITKPHVEMSFNTTGGHSTSYNIPDDKILANLTETEMIQIYGKFVSTISVLCHDQARFGKFVDGGKIVCLDEKFKPKKPCVVYSFGSQFQFDFELAVKKYLGCEIYTFDPTLNIKGQRQEATKQAWPLQTLRTMLKTFNIIEQRQEGEIPDAVHFTEVGLAGKNHVTKQSWPMKTLRTIMQDNGHENTTIDVLKLDIEGYEWEAIPEMLESGAFRHVKQLLFEAHFGHMHGNLQNLLWLGIPMTKQLRALRMLEEYGFGLFMHEPYTAALYKVDATSDNTIPSQNELSFINTAFFPT